MNDEAGVIVEVEVDPQTAFDVFTSDVAAWWNRDRSLWGTPGVIRFEPGVGGRLLLDGEREVGRVTVWEPGPRLAFSYGPDDDARTEVEVRFEATKTGTRVVLRHRGWTEETTGPWAQQLAGFARHALERVLLHRLGEFLDAIGAGDLDFFERNLTDDALLIFPEGVYTKEQCVASMAGHAPYVKYDIENPRVVHTGVNTAVLTHKANVYNTAQPEPQTVMVSSVLAKVDGQWRLALHQWTPTD